MIFVVDACVAIKWYVQEDGHQQAIGLLESDGVLVAPDYLEIEFAAVVSKMLRRSQIGTLQSEAMLADLGRSISRLEPTRVFLAEAMTLSLTLNHPVYDCLYLAMARATNGRLVTADTKFADKVAAAGLAGLVLRLADFNPDATREAT